MAESIETALYEVQAFGFPPHAVAIVPVQVDLRAVVDLRDISAQSLLQIFPKELALNFRATARSATQELGERAAASRCVDGFLYDSVALRGTVNLAVFEESLSALGSTISVDDPANGLAARLP